MRVLGQAVKVEGSEQGWLRHPAPVLGQHTAEILGELGLDGDRIEALRQAGVVAG